MTTNATDHSSDAFTARKLRRERLARALGAGVAIIPTAAEKLRNRDSDYLFRYDSYFWYLSGFPEPEAVLVIVAGDTPRSILFCREKHPERELWDGFRFGPEAARERFGVDEAWSIAALDEQLPRLLANQPAVHFAAGADAAWDARVLGWINAVRAQSRTGVTAPAQIHDVRLPLDEMGARASLLHIEAGGRIPEHTHQGYELTLLLAGTIEDGDTRYKAGDFIWRDASHSRSTRPATSATAKARVSASDGDIRVSGG